MVRLINRNTKEVVFSASVPVGAGMTVRKTKIRTFFRFANPPAKSVGGISMFKVAEDSHFYRVNLWAWGDLSGATSEMTVELQFGKLRWTSPGKWKKTLKGWYMFLK